MGENYHNMLRCLTKNANHAVERIRRTRSVFIFILILLTPLLFHNNIPYIRSSNWNYLRTAAAAKPKLKT